VDFFKYQTPDDGVKKRMIWFTRKGMFFEIYDA